MKVIFLDIDGILNTDRQIKLNALKGITTIKFDPNAMGNLKEIVDETGAKIVVTSTWREKRDSDDDLWKKLILNLQEFDLAKEIFDVTPTLGEYTKPEIRESEIIKWLSNHNEVVNFVILDDQITMGSLNDHFIKCIPFRGITEDIRDEAIIKLKKNER